MAGACRKGCLSCSRWLCVRVLGEGRKSLGEIRGDFYMLVYCLVRLFNGELFKLYVSHSFEPVRAVFCHK